MNLKERLQKGWIFRLFFSILKSNFMSNNSSWWDINYEVLHWACDWFQKYKASKESPTTKKKMTLTLYSTNFYWFFLKIGRKPDLDGIVFTILALDFFKQLIIMIKICQYDRENLSLYLFSFHTSNGSIHYIFFK